MLFVGLTALSGAVVVDHALSAHRQSKGPGPGLETLRMRPCSWGKGSPWPLPPPLSRFCSTSPRAAVPRTSILGGPRLLLSGCVCSAWLVSVLLQRWRRGWRCCGCCWHSGGWWCVYSEWCYWFLIPVVQSPPTSVPHHSIVLSTSLCPCFVAVAVVWVGCGCM